MATYDENLLQYCRPGSDGECELIIGLDFGTSASKVVIRAPDLPGSPVYPVDFGDFAHESMSYLLPTRLWVGQQGICTLGCSKGSRSVIDIKLELFSDDRHLNSSRGPTEQDLSPKATAVAYLSLLLRNARRWFLEEHRDVVGHFGRLNWSVNLGVPSPCIENNEENQCFQQVGKAAWMLSTLDDQIAIGQAEDELRYLSETPDYWERRDDRLTCDFDIIPEIAAGAVGYALSGLRREGLHVIVDIGASTIDVCTFILHARGGSDRYSLLTADVQVFGTVRLHHERILAINSAYNKRAKDLRDNHDPLMPIAEDIEEYLVSREHLVTAVKHAENDLWKKLQRSIKRVIWESKMRRDPDSPVWDQHATLPILFIGGGSRLPFYHSAVQELDGWLKQHALNGGTSLLPLPDSLGIKSVEYRRIAVAVGLSHRALDIGDITPADRIPDAEPPTTWKPPSTPPKWV